MIRNIAYLKSGNSAYIDLADYGVTLVRGCYEALLTPASVKAYVTNNSRLMHGTQYAIAPNFTRTESRNVSLQFFLEGRDRADYIAKLQTFMDAISNGVIKLKVPALGYVYSLVYTKCNGYGNFGKNRGKFTAQFVEPNVTNRETIS